MGLLVSMIFAANAGEYGPSVEGEWVVTEAYLPDAVSNREDTGVDGCSSEYLEDGVQLPDLPLFYKRMVPNSAWGTQEMVDLIVETSRHMRWLMPDADPILIGDISNRHGGYFSGHKSHRAGIDADIGLYWKGGEQTGNFTEVPPSQFDAEANWAMMSTMLQTGKVDMILLDRSLIAVLKDYTLSAGLLTAEEAAQIFPGEGRGTWTSSGVIRHAPGHSGHMHVRTLCSDGSRAR